jgi:hypothetical protein
VYWCPVSLAVKSLVVQAEANTFRAKKIDDHVNRNGTDLFSEIFPHHIQVLTDREAPGAFLIRIPRTPDRIGFS